MSASPDVYFFDQSFDVSMNASVDVDAHSSFSPSMYDYVLTINTDLNALFSNKSFVQNSSDPDKYDVNVTLDQAALRDAADSKVEMASESKAEEAGTLDGQVSINDRYMEMIACKLFGNGNARAAIVNDQALLAAATTGKTLLESVAIHAQSVLTDHSGNMLRQYMNSNRTSNQDDAAGNSLYSNFNFDGQVLSFPAMLNGTVSDSVGPSSLPEWILNRDLAKVGGVSPVENGAYAIKILVKIGNQSA